MAISSHFKGGLSLAALFVLLLSILDITFAAPLPRNSIGKDVSDKRLSKRVSPDTITLDEYVEYLKTHYTETFNNICLYTGNSEDQVKAFQAANPGYYRYADYYDSETSKHYKNYFGEVFDAAGEEIDRDDAEAASKAIAMVASGEVTVFGAANYKSYDSFYRSDEAGRLVEGLNSGRLQTIKHMELDAKLPTEVFATEDAAGKFTYMGDHQAGEANDSGSRLKVPYGNTAAQDTSRTGGSGSPKPATVKPAAAKPATAKPGAVKAPTHI